MIVTTPITPSTARGIPRACARVSVVKTGISDIRCASWAPSSSAPAARSSSIRPDDVRRVSRRNSRKVDPRRILPFQQFPRHESLPIARIVLRGIGKRSAVFLKKGGRPGSEQPARGEAKRDRRQNASLYATWKTAISSAVRGTPNRPCGIAAAAELVSDRGLKSRPRRDDPVGGPWRKKTADPPSCGGVSKIRQSRAYSVSDDF
jgi:hypothetical protein